MPSLYSGIANPLIPFLPAAVAIASSTHATPIVVTTSSPHGAETGDLVVIDGHDVNTNANGPWQVVKTSATTLILVGSNGNGTGGATGTAHSAAFGSFMQIPSGTDKPNAASVAVGLESSADRTAFLFYSMQYAQTIQPGGTVDFLGRSLLKLEAGANVHGEVGALLSGSFEVVPFSTIKLDGSATLHLLSGATETLDAGSFVNANGTINVNASGSTGLLQICNNGVQNVLSGGLLDIKGDGSTSGSGDVILRSGALLEGKSGSAIRTDGSLTVEGGATVDISTAALNLDGTAISWGATSGAVETGKHTDASTVTRTGPTIQSGVSGYVGHRERYLSGNATGTENIATSQYEIIVTATTQTGDVVFNLADPPNGERLDITICVFAARTNGHQLTVQGSGGALFAVVGGTDDFWFDYRWSPGVGNWVKVRTGKFV